MPYIVDDRIGETTTSTGTGNLTLAGAINSSFKALSAVYANTDTFPGLILAVDGNGNPTGDWETGTYTWTTGGVIQRTAVYKSSNGNAAVNFAAGTKHVRVAPHERALAKQTPERAVMFPPVSAAPPAPVSGGLLYPGPINAGVLPTWKDATNIEEVLQQSFGYSSVAYFGVGSGTSLTTFGCAVTNVGTISSPTPASTNFKTHTRRSLNQSAATAGSLASSRVSLLECSRGNTANAGGFLAVLRFGINALQTGNRGFFGVHSTISAPTNIDPLADTTLGKLGIAFNTDTGNLFLINNAVGVAPTTLDLGAGFAINTTDLWELTIFCYPNDTVIYYQIKNLSTGANVAGQFDSNIPTNTTWLSRVMWMTNNATAAAVTFDVVSFYLGKQF